MELVGTKYGGWWIPKNIDFNEDSIIYSGGVGEDISFDIAMQSKYNCNIFLIDPTERAIKHYDQCKNYFTSKDKSIFTGDIQKDYFTVIDNYTPKFSKFNYYSIGIWDSKTTLKFYKQTNKRYVSQSLINNMFGEQYTTIETTTIKDIMSNYEHDHIDLLKLDIEGAEVKVINNMLDDKIYPKYLCIEFDLFLKKKDQENGTSKVMKRIESLGYKILKNDNMNITYKL